jgi:hypothetical protein
MAIQGQIIQNFRSEYSENLLPILDGNLNISSGTNISVSYDSNLYFDNNKCIKNTFIVGGDTDRATYNIDGYTTTIKNTGRHILSYRFLKPSIDPEITFWVQMFVNGILTAETTIENTLDTNTLVGNWVCFSQSFNLNEDDVITFKFQSVSDVIGSVLYFDALKLEYDDRNLGTPSIYSKPLVSGASIPSEFIFVSSLNDLPAPITGVITLEDDKTYYITSTIDLNGSRLVGGSNTTILGASSENSILTSTGLGVGVALISSIYTTPIRNICIKDVDTALSFDGTSNPNPMALDWTGVNFVNVTNIGTIKKANNFIFDKGSFINSKGLKFDGTIGTVALNNSLFSGDGLAGDLIKLLSTCVITRRFRVIYSSVVAFGSTIGINVDVSATIPVESYILDTINFSGGGTYLSGVTVSDNKTNFVKCKGIQNTKEVSLYYMHANATTTVISATNTPVKVLGTTTSSTITQKFTNTNNRATYNGSLTRTFKVTVSASCTSGNNNIVGFYIAKNGIVTSDSEIYSTTSGTGKSENVSIQTLISLSENDYIEIWVENNSSITNVLVSDLNVIIE